jgi:SAM-dependent methyltransferase
MKHVNELKPESPPTLQQGIEPQIQSIASFYESHGENLTGHGRAYRTLLSHYYRHLVPQDASVLEIGCGAGHLLAELPNRDVTGIDVSPRQIQAAKERVPHGSFHVGAGENVKLDRTFDCIIISDTIHQAADVQQMLENALNFAKNNTRLLLNFYSALWKPLLSLSVLLGIRKRQPPSNWLAPDDVLNLLRISGWDPIVLAPRILMPIRCLGLEHVANRWLAPLLPWLNLTVFCTARPRRNATQSSPSVSVIVPARNEAGNIRHAVTRLPEFAGKTEIIFVEGGSSDNTWDEIERVCAEFPEKQIVKMRQTGSGKGAAVRDGFAAATGDILMILDADLTTPPEELPKFYRVLASGQADFANGVRLVYPMEERAMQFLNMCANKMFSILFTWLLGQPVKDTLCGTKVLWRRDYEKLAAQRSYFGNFDPFGDFDLLFGAARMNLKIVDIPVHYKSRTYGETNIQRWKHGALLIRMALYAARKIKFL